MGTNAIEASCWFASMADIFLKKNLGGDIYLFLSVFRGFCWRQKNVLSGEHMFQCLYIERKGLHT